MMKKQLIIPMYRLNTTKDIKDIFYDERNLYFFKRDYTIEERRKQFEALKWAMENPEYDFKSVSPIFKDLKFSNDEIFIYLKKVHDFMKDNSLDKE